MKPFLSLAVLLLMCVSTAHAANVWVNKNETTKKETQQNEELLELLDEAPAPVKKSRPEPQNITQFANAYYKNCLKQGHPALDENGLNMLCACTSANISKNMTVQNMRDMQTNSAEGHTQRARVMMFSYAPCIEHPAKLLVTQQCLKDLQARATEKNYYEVCDCQGNGVAEFMRERMPRTIESGLNRNLANFDPLNLLLQSTAFEQESQYHRNRCAQKYRFSLGR